MPIYEYECKSCGEKFELRRGMADSDAEIRCLKCGAKHPRRVFSAFATGSSSPACAPSAST
ncbi:MAG: zinc ribbon domain-containing protein [Dehalococcoidia bacterium]|nr:zinc ribbon domain-containing protein [Dehalococcoidia bacterium]